ncbi:vWA domain-containing protein [Methylomonas sp. MK1]|uniref:vWA domain-containing protein n=1 Tax=Methylomonas sp. MK1 TaxID=1131552 RepID=UPI00035F9D6E|nr:VWA domain-containing protein [Methylomonas sp. MK1]
MNFADFHFLRPWWLLAVLPAALFLILLVRHRHGRGNWSEVCDAELLPFILQDKPLQQSRGNLFGAGFAALLTIVALAGPTWQRLPGPAFRNDAALVIALDLSKSMDAADIKPSRIGKARYKIADLLKQRKDGQTALLVYGGDAFTVTPLTNDTATIDSQLAALTTDIMPSPGSNTGVALNAAVALLRQAGLVKGHILLVTDGADADVAEQAEHWLGDYRLSVLAMGTPEGAPIQLQGAGFLKDSNGAIVVAKLDEAALSTLAQHGRGIYQPVTANDADVENLGRLFNSADTGGENLDSNLLLQQWDEKGPWLLLLVLPWAALQFRKGLLLALLCLLPLPKNSYALDWQSLWQTPDQRAKQAFEQQQYQQAAEQFDNPDWRAAAQYKAGQYQEAAETLKNTQSAEGHYNRGNALAKAGQLQEAVQAYQQALQLDPKHQDAKYNKELVEKKLKEQEQQNQQDQNQQDEQKQDKQKSSDQQQKQQQQDGKSDQDDKDSQQEQKPQDQQKADAKQDAEQNKAKEDQQSEAEAKQQAEPQPPKQEPTDQEKAAQATEKNETERANEQLLKRIPDEPTGLLKRKFKYQYGQRNRANQSGPAW